MYDWVLSDYLCSLYRSYAVVVITYVTMVAPLCSK
jgi:hypothetical protein